MKVDVWGGGGGGCLSNDSVCMDSIYVFYLEERNIEGEKISEYNIKE